MILNIFRTESGENAMNTKIFTWNEERGFEADELAEAAQIIRDGGLVAFPTETVYGLGGNGLDPQASKKIYAAKGRPSDNPLILHIAKNEQLHEVVSEIPEAAATLAEAFWPGPLTMIFKKADCVPYETTGGHGCGAYATAHGGFTIFGSCGCTGGSAKCQYVRPSKPDIGKTCKRRFRWENRYDHRRRRSGNRI